MTKVNWKGMYPPDRPIYKEGWSIAIQPPKEKDSVRYNLVVGRALCNKALLILRKRNPSI
jgi:hypothetical protein